MSDNNLPYAPFVKTSGLRVPESEVYDIGTGRCQKSTFEQVSIEVAHGSFCTFLVIRGEKETQYISLDSLRVSVLGHALTAAAEYAK